MKKVLVAVALVMGLGSSVAFAQEVSNTPVVENQTQAPQDEYTKVEVKDLPEAVAQAIAKSYEGATIKEAYVAEKETGKVYKVILTTKDAQEVTVLLNEKGEEVKTQRESTMKDDQIIKKNLDEANNLSRDKDLDKSNLNLDSFHDLDKFNK